MPPAVSLHRRQRESHRHYRHSKFVAKLGYGLDLFVRSITLVLAQILLPLFFPRMRSIYPPKEPFRIDLTQKLRVRFPLDSSRTDRSEDLGLTDLAQAIAQVQLSLTEVY